MCKILPLLILIVIVIGIFVLQKSYSENIVYLPDGKPIYVEVAKTPEEREKGLMFRESLGENEGMFFVFESDGYHSIWMKNMLFPIDVVWLDSDFKVIHIERNILPCREEPCPIYTPPSPARYILEVNANVTKSLPLRL